jgi:hypothetical protein
MLRDHLQQCLTDQATGANDSNLYFSFHRLSVDRIHIEGEKADIEPTPAWNGLIF